MRYLISIPLLLLLGGCADLGYYWHNARGHLAVMDKRIDIGELLADGKLGPGLRERLLLVREIRRFSIERLGLPDNGSYSGYVELDRPYVVQNLFAAPEFSTRLRQWCYPIVGCAGYRGYYDEKRLRNYAQKLRSEGFEVHIGKVSAYSTLGWFDDPVLSSFIDWPDYRLAGLLFHELTHQQVYIDDDTTFNESLASAVQQVGAELWLDAGSRSDELENLLRWQRYRGEVTALIEATREKLSAIYSRDIDDASKRRMKSAAFETARTAHADIAAKFSVTGGYTHWFEGELNNAKFGSVSAYNSRVPAFVNMIRAHKTNFTAFFVYVEKLGKLGKNRRDKCMSAWSLQSGWQDAACPEAAGNSTCPYQKPHP